MITAGRDGSAGKGGLPGVARISPFGPGSGADQSAAMPSPVAVPVLLPQQAGAHGWEVRTPVIDARPVVHNPGDARWVRAVEFPDVASETAIRSPAEVVGNRVPSSFRTSKEANGACCIPLEGRMSGLVGHCENDTREAAGGLRKEIDVVRLFRLGRVAGRLRVDVIGSARMGCPIIFSCRRSRPSGRRDFHGRHGWPP